MYKLKEKKWSNGTTTYHVVHTEKPDYEGQVPYHLHLFTTYLEQAKAHVDSMNKTVVSERIIYP